MMKKSQHEYAEIHMGKSYQSFLLRVRAFVKQVRPQDSLVVDHGSGHVDLCLAEQIKHVKVILIVLTDHVVVINKRLVQALVKEHVCIVE
jgi:broad specificity phosphatase PhoE